MTEKEAFDRGYQMQMDHTMRCVTDSNMEEANKAMLADMRAVFATNDLTIIHAYKRGIAQAQSELLSTQTETSGTGQPQQ